MKFRKQSCYDCCGQQNYQVKWIGRRADVTDRTVGFFKIEECAECNTRVATKIDETEFTHLDKLCTPYIGASRP
jgi:hypothetical protein